MVERSPGALERAASAWGVQLGYETHDQARARPPDEAVLAVLHELGAPVAAPPDLPDAVRARQAERWALPVEPVVVSWADPGEGRLRARRGGSAVTIRLPATEADGELVCELTREDGSTSAWSLPARELEGRRGVEVGGRAQLAGRLPLPTDLSPGYHDLTVRTSSRQGRARVIRAPRRAWTPSRAQGGEPRDWGLFVPTYALWTGRSHGVADLTDLERLQRWTAARGGGVVATLPLLAAFLDRPFDPSPYAPVSRLFWNELYLDPERAPGLDRSPAAQRLLGSDEYRRESARLRNQPEVDYRATMAHRRLVLEKLAAAVAPAGAPLPDALAAFAAAHPEAEPYARFRALVERHGRPWREWPAEASLPGNTDQDAVRYHLYAQWAMDLQLASQSRGAEPEGNPRAPLYMDLPVGSHAAGFDVWRWRALFADAAAGAPPDFFFAAGQNWGFPPLHPRRSREEGHAYWIASLRHVMRVSGMLRLDHVMGLHRLYWIPRGFGADEGVYVRYPARELYATLCLESHRHRTELVGEDLGTVPREVRAAMERHRLKRMHVVPFELDLDRAALAQAPADSVACLETHDMPPFRAFLEGRDVAERVAQGQLPEERAAKELERRRRWREALARALDARVDDPAGLLRATLSRLAEGPARLVLVALEDLWLETEPQNRPGLPGSENWRRRIRHSLEELDQLEEVVSVLSAVDRARRLTGAPGSAADRPRAEPAGRSVEP